MKLSPIKPLSEVEPDINDIISKKDKYQKQFDFIDKHQMWFNIIGGLVVGAGLILSFATVNSVFMLITMIVLVSAMAYYKSCHEKYKKCINKIEDAKYNATYHITNEIKEHLKNEFDRICDENGIEGNPKNNIRSYIFK